MVIADAMVLIIGTLLRMTPFFRWKLSTMASVPCPSASGAKLKTISPAMRPPMAGNAIATHRTSGTPRKKTSARLAGKYEPDQVFHEKTRRGLEEEIENDGPEAGNDPDQDAERVPRQMRLILRG